MRKKRIETGYQVFVALQDLYIVLASFIRKVIYSLWDRTHLLERVLNVTVVLLMKRLRWEGGNGLEIIPKTRLHRLRVLHHHLVESKEGRRLLTGEIDLAHRL